MKKIKISYHRKFDLTDKVNKHLLYTDQSKYRLKISKTKPREKIVMHQGFTPLTRVQALIPTANVLVSKHTIYKPHVLLKYQTVLVRE